LRIETCNAANLQRELRNQHTHILRQINHDLRVVGCQSADQLAKEILAREINLTDDSRKIFKAVQAIKSTKRPPSSTIHTQAGKCIGTDQGNPDVTRKWFAKQFCDQSDEQLDPFIGNPHLLNLKLHKHLDVSTMDMSQVPTTSMTNC